MNITKILWREVRWYEVYWAWGRKEIEITQCQELINESDDSNMAGPVSLLLSLFLNLYLLLPFLTYHLYSCLSILLFSPFPIHWFYLPFHLKPCTQFSVSLPLFSLSSFVPSSLHFLLYKWIIPPLSSHSPSLPLPSTVYYTLPSTLPSILSSTLPNPTLPYPLPYPLLYPTPVSAVYLPVTKAPLLFNAKQFIIGPSKPDAILLLK